MGLRRRYLPLAGLLAAVIGVQLAASATNSTFYLTQLTMAAYYCLVIIGLCLLMGYAGQISLGHAGFFAIGGYLSAALTSHNFTAVSDTLLMRTLDRAGLLLHHQSLYGDSLLSLQPWLAFFIAIGVAVLIAFVLGIPVLKLKGHYLAMATLGFGIIIYRIVLAAEFFGEADGISEVPPFQLMPGLAVSGDFSARVQNYYIAWALLLFGLLLLLNLINSRMGRALRAIHGSEEAAEAIGINTARAKLYTFVISAAFAAVAGSLLTHFNGGIGPSEASVMKSVRYVAIVAVGGMANLWGAMAMGIILNFMSLRGMFGSYDDAVFGGVLLLIMLFAPQGILSLRLKNILWAKRPMTGK
ncbi:MAG TPA: branched-chain amino acid ABC transporter permease [Desulfobulbaceae bacterium]|nr:branched-chain amino acid ABC transporter permease [Desulfobulbaceae bacterium]